MSKSPVPPSLGEVVDGRFRIRAFHRRGGMGELYDAMDETTGERVALKVLRPGSGASAERFDREGAVLATLDDPGIVRHVAHGVTSRGQRYIAMEWLEGEDLAERLRRAPLTLGEVVVLGLALARALAASHAHDVIHRDLKPRNVFLPGCSVERAKLIDFGLARAHEGMRELTRTGVALGTRGYMAPEQVFGDKRTVGPRADLFALGCVLYECVARRGAFEAGDSNEVLRRILFADPPPLPGHADVPPPLAALIESALAKDPEDRPADAVAFAGALASVPLAADRDGVRLEVVEGADAGLVRIVNEPTVDLGKHPSATLPLGDSAVSRFHCEIARRDETLEVRDLGSTNGLTVDGVRVTRAELCDGAVLGLGSSRVRVARTPGGVRGPAALERAQAGDMNVLLEGDGWEPRAFAEALHARSARHRAVYVVCYGAALRVEDLAQVTGGTLLLLEAESLTVEAQDALARFFETRAVPTAHGRAAADVRIVAHAGIDLRLLVNTRRFRPDVLYGLAGVRLRTSP